MDFSEILSHPDKDEIIAKLIDGTQPSSVNRWLRLKYKNSDQKHLHIPIKLLEQFLHSPYLDLKSKFHQDLNAVQSAGGNLDKKISDSLLNSKTYQERIAEYAQDQIDIKKMYVTTIQIMMDRAIQVFDKIQENPSVIGKAEYTLIKWFEQIFSVLEKYDRHANAAPDQIIQHNYTVQYVDQQAAILQDIVREVISELDPEISMKFIDKLNRKIAEAKSEMNKLVPPSDIKQLESAEQVKNLKEIVLNAPKVI